MIALPIFSMQLFFMADPFCSQTRLWILIRMFLPLSQPKDTLKVYSIFLILPKNQPMALIISCLVWKIRNMSTMPCPSDICLGMLLPIIKNIKKLLPETGRTKPMLPRMNFFPGFKKAYTLCLTGKTERRYDNGTMAMYYRLGE